MNDLKFALRQLAKNPGFTAVAVLTLALGIGANTAIFSLIDAMLLKPLRVEDPQKLVIFSIAGPNGSQDTFNYPLIQRFIEANHSFTGIFASNHGDRMRMRVAEPGGNSQVESVRAEQVSGNYFSVLGVQAIVGRTLAESDDSVSDPQPVTVISSDLWRRRFGADPNIVGRKVSLNDFPFTVVGVMAEGFIGSEAGGKTDLWWPIRVKPLVFPGNKSLESQTSWWLQVMARLRPGVSLERARTEMDLVLRQQLSEVPGEFLSSMTPAQRQRHFDQRIELRSGSAGWSRLRSEFRQPLLLLMTVVGLVLLIACANVANLLLARAAARQKEISVRLALGAGRFRLVRLLLTESVLLTAMAGALGLFFAYQGTRALLDYLPHGSPVLFQVAPDVRVLGFTLAISLLTGLLFGLAPALRATRLDLITSLKEKTGAGSAVRPGLALNKTLIVMQVALSLFLLVGAGLFVRSLEKLKGLDTGFNRENVLVFTVDPGNAFSSAQRMDVCRQLLARLEALPGARAASVSGWHLLSGTQSNDKLIVPGYTPRPDENTTCYLFPAGPKFFETMGIALLQGREFGPQDETLLSSTNGPTAPVAVVINQALANHFFANESPLGKLLYYPGQALKDIPLQVVGVVKDAKYQDLREPTRRTLYVSYFQRPVEWEAMAFQLRTEGNPSGFGGAIERIVREVDPRLQVIEQQTMKEVMSEAMGRERLVAQLAGFFSLFALLLACIGLYGIMSYAVTRRTGEIGIRMALGARTADVINLVMKETLLLVAVGVVLGLSAALATTRLISTLLYGLAANDPLTIGMATVLLICVAALAGYLPARKASRVDPLIALRTE